MRPEHPIPLPEDLAAKLDSVRAQSSSADTLHALVLFGSLARGKAHEWSDADVGVLFSRPAHYDQWATLLATVESALGRPVDLVDLATAALPVRARAVLEGRPIAVNDEEAWARFVARTILDWLDYRPAYQRAVRIAVARLAERPP